VILVKVSLKQILFLDDDGNIIKIKFIAGFLGIGQNSKTGALRSCLGWISASPIMK
jgi:hypothetical protein